MLRKIRLGTRASQLALTQSKWVKKNLENLGAQVELITIRTDGDIKNDPLLQIGGQGLFTKQLQIALLENRIDLAVHSLKDLPTQDQPGLTIAAVPVREDRSDALVSARGIRFEELPSGSVIGTGSLRRSAQLKHLRSDLQIEQIRGNVDTRLAKLDSGEFDAIVLASAGLNRLGLQHRITHPFACEQILPAVGQGALGLETRTDDLETRKKVGDLNDPASFATAMAERAMLRRLFAGCLSPVGANTKIVEGKLELTGIVLSHDGSQSVTATDHDETDQCHELGIRVAELLLKNGAEQLMNQNR